MGQYLYLVPLYLQYSVPRLDRLFYGLMISCELFL